MNKTYQEMREVLETVKYVAEKSRMVQIDIRALKRFARKLLDDGTRIPPWDPRYHFFDGIEDTVTYLMVLDSLNFCFWPSAGKSGWEIQYRSEKLSGYYALAASLTKAMESDIPITDPQYLAGISSDELNRILGGHGKLQLMEHRAKILNELGQVLIVEYGGRATKLVESAENSAVRLARLMAEKLPSFRDVTEFRGREVFFYKRAQIFVSDLHCAFKGKDWGFFRNMEGLTCFADYKLPQVLRHLGILKYAQDLAQKVDQKILLKPGSPEEVEIRANTIWTVELIRQELDHVGKAPKAFEIDWLLWSMGQEKEFRKKPYHRTVTVFY